MEELKYSQEIIDLGKKLIREFSAHDKRDLTLSWMAHYLSELILSAEKEQDKTRKAELNKEACDMILTLWQNRNDFPRGTRPLNGLSLAVEVIKSLRRQDPDMDYWQRNREYQENGPWGNFADIMRNSSEKIFALTIFASIGQDALSKEKEWAEFPNLLSDEEKELLEYIDEILEQGENPIKIHYTSSGKKDKPRKVEKIDKVLGRIEKLLKQQQEKFEILKLSVLKGREIVEDSDDWEDELNDFLD